MELCELSMGKVEDFLEGIPSKHTRKNYLHSLKVFERWYGKSITNLVKSPEATKTIEKFYVHLKETHPQNTCRNQTNAAIQFLKYFDTQLHIRKALGIYRTEVSSDDHKLTVEEIQKMSSVADLKEQVILETLLLGLRIGDAITLKIRDFDLTRGAPVELKIRATKEGTVYDTFISQEFQDILKLYIPTLKGKFLFPGMKENTHSKDETLNHVLKRLAERVGIQLHGRLHWHCGRKLVMRTGAELGVSPWIVKKLVGKSIPKSDDTYLSDTDLKEGFLKIHNVLRLKIPTNGNGKINNLKEALDVVMKVQRKMIEKELKSMGYKGVGFIVEKTDEEVLREYLEES